VDHQDALTTETAGLPEASSPSIVRWTPSKPPALLALIRSTAWKGFSPKSGCPIVRQELL
jgi:hypothetical protein